MENTFLQDFLLPIMYYVIAICFFTILFLIVKRKKLTKKDWANIFELSDPYALAFVVGIGFLIIELIKKIWN
jgi:predicted MPP superfamily phosphohydrolase